MTEDGEIQIAAQLGTSCTARQFGGDSGRFACTKRLLVVLSLQEDVFLEHLIYYKVSRVALCFLVCETVHPCLFAGVGHGCNFFNLALIPV